MTRIKTLSIIFILLIIIQGCSWPLAHRLRGWAEPLSIEGVENFYRVSPSLYRGAQPSSEGFKSLKSLGIVTIVSLRKEGDGDIKLIEGLNFKYYRIPTTVASINRYDLEKFIRIVKEPENCPVFVHCLHGSDRTGLACATYRVWIQHWSVPEARLEMIRGGYNYHPVWFWLPMMIREQ